MDTGASISIRLITYLPILIINNAVTFKMCWINKLADLGCKYFNKLLNEYIKISLIIDS